MLYLSHLDVSRAAYIHSFPHSFLTCVTPFLLFFDGNRCRVNCYMLSIQDRKNGNVVLGKICVHDRVKVECNILPRFFAHSSYASFRRQLNYFSFNRIGKGRQLGATYCNDNVIDLEDVLSLKRRSVTHNCNSGIATLALESTSTPTEELERTNKGTVKEDSVSSLGGGIGGCNDTSKAGSRHPSGKKRKESPNPKKVGKRHRATEYNKIHQTPKIGTAVLPKGCRLPSRSTAKRVLPPQRGSHLIWRHPTLISIKLL